MSIGYTSPINGSNVAFSILAASPGSSGGAIRGYMPSQNQTVNKASNEFEDIRFTLKQAWNTQYRTQLKNSGLKQSITGPFRAVNNAGDLLGRENYSCGGSCQSFQSRPNLRGLRGHFGSTSSSCTPSATYSALQLNDRIPSATCNVKYVYDSSDFTRFLKQKAVSLNYNDITYSGNSSSTSQSAVRASRRY
jgi:hypothetical protein